MRFEVLGNDGGLAVWDSGTNGWWSRTYPLDQRDEVEQVAIELNLRYDQHSPRHQAHRRPVIPPVKVETWQPGGVVEWWVREATGRWVALIRTPDGTHQWVEAADVRPADRGRL